MASRKKYRKKLNTKKRMQKGGILVMNPELDLINRHMCNLKPGKQKETIADEIYTYNGTIFPLNTTTIGYTQLMFKKQNNKWFKFVVFNNDGQNCIYLITGGRINKHSVCMLVGLLDATLEKNEYIEIREAVNQLEMFKLAHKPEIVFATPELMAELTTLKSNLDNLVNKDIKCMPVLSAGSGTINDDNSICINNKSGHYKPTLESMELAKRVFEELTGGVPTIVTEKVDKELLMEKYGEDYEDYTGICL
jgi:hypothetical protein